VKGGIVTVKIDGIRVEFLNREIARSFLAGALEDFPDTRLEIVSG
jgi:hypothetical protein